MQSATPPVSQTFSLTPFARRSFQLFAFFFCAPLVRDGDMCRRILRCPHHRRAFRSENIDFAHTQLPCMPHTRFPRESLAAHLGRTRSPARKRPNAIRTAQLVTLFLIGAIDVSVNTLHSVSCPTLTWMSSLSTLSMNYAESAFVMRFPVIPLTWRSNMFNMSTHFLITPSAKILFNAHQSGKTVQRLFGTGNSLWVSIRHDTCAAQHVLCIHQHLGE